MQSLDPTLDVLQPYVLNRDGREIINWHGLLKALQNMPDEQRHDDSNHERSLFSAAYYASAEWVTCACGAQCDALPRDGDGAPLDAQLLQLGVRFVDCISDEQYAYALETLAAIEERSAELLQELAA